MKLSQALALSLTLHAAAYGLAHLGPATPAASVPSAIDVDMFRLGEKNPGAVPKSASRPDSPKTVAIPQSSAVEGLAAVSAAVPAPRAGATSVTLTGEGSRVLSIAEYVQWVRTHNDPPSYPRVSRTLGEQGKAQVRVTVARRGSPPETIELLAGSGFERLDHAALESVRAWRFPPFEASDSSITMTIPFSFVLEDR